MWWRESRFQSWLESSLSRSPPSAIRVTLPIGCGAPVESVTTESVVRYRSPFRSSIAACDEIALSTLGVSDPLSNTDTCPLPSGPPKCSAT